MTIFERIDQILSERNMSRRQLATLAKIPPSSLQSAMERKRNMTLEMSESIANALETDVNWLRTGEALPWEQPAELANQYIDPSQRSNYIRESRESQNITLQELAYLANISKTTLSEYENGVSKPPTSSLRRIAMALNVSTEYLLTGDKTKKPPYYRYLNRKDTMLPGEDPYADEEIAEMNARIHRSIEQRKKLEEATKAHLELMDEAEDFKTIYDECLSDRGKRKLHEYMEDLIKNPDNIKGTLKVPDDSIHNDDEPDND